MLNVLPQQQSKQTKPKKHQKTNKQTKKCADVDRCLLPDYVTISRVCAYVQTHQMVRLNMCSSSDSDYTQESCSLKSAYVDEEECVPVHIPKPSE